MLWLTSANCLSGNWPSGIKWQWSCNRRGSGTIEVLERVRPTGAVLVAKLPVADVELPSLAVTHLESPVVGTPNGGCPGFRRF